MNVFYNCSYLLNFISPKVQVLSILLFLIILLFSLRNRINTQNLKKNKIYLIPLIFIMVGGFINLFQRFLNGCVYDNIAFLGLVSFNVWDVMVVFGLFVIFIKNDVYFVSSSEQKS